MFMVRNTPFYKASSSRAVPSACCGFWPRGRTAAGFGEVGGHWEQAGGGGHGQLPTGSGGVQQSQDQLVPHSAEWDGPLFVVKIAVAWNGA